MKRGSSIFLQIVIVALGICTLIFILWEPHLEGRNIHSTLFQIYFNDPFLAYAYAVSILFFTALYQVFNVLEYIRQNKIFSLNSVKALRTIRYCAIAIAALVAAPVAYLFIAQPDDDIAGGVVIGLAIIFISTIVANATAIFEQILQNIIDIKSEN